MPLTDYDSGRYWAGLFIAKLIKTVSRNRRQNK